MATDQSGIQFQHVSAYVNSQANEKDYSHEGFGFTFKKTQADVVMKLMSSKEVNYFKGDETATKVSCCRR
jgi:hypothetical protein